MSTDAALTLAHALAAETVRNPLLPPVGVVIGVAVAAVAVVAIAVIGIVIAVVKMRRGRR